MLGGWAGSRGRGRFFARQDAEESILQKQPQPESEDQTRMRRVCEHDAKHVSMKNSGFVELSNIWNRLQKQARLRVCAYIPQYTRSNTKPHYRACLPRTRKRVSNSEPQELWTGNTRGWLYLSAGSCPTFGAASNDRAQRLAKDAHMLTTVGALVAESQPSFTLR